MTRGFNQHYQRLGTRAAVAERERRRALAELSPKSEAELRAIIRDALRQMGWMVRDLSQRKRVEGGLTDMPDLIAWKHGRTLMIETKHGRNDLRAGQRDFAREIDSHCDPRSLVYCVARSLDDVLSALGL